MSILTDTAKRFPGLWSAIEKAREERKEQWPFWCYCPMDIVAEESSKIGDVFLAFQYLAHSSAAVSWRPTQSIYRFEPDLYESLIRTPVEKIPVDVLYQLPEWCVCLDHPHGIALEGIEYVQSYLWMEYDLKTGRHELRIILFTDDPKAPGLNVPLHISESETVSDAIRAGAEEARKNAKKIGNIVHDIDDHAIFLISDLIGRVINLALYLCAKNANFNGPRPSRPKPVKIKKGWRIFPANSPVVRLMGVPEIEHKTVDIAGTKKSPHIRSAHWHTYLVGKGRTKRELRWISATKVGNLIKD